MSNSMKDFDINELDFKEIGSWPLPVKIGFIIFICLLTSVLGYVLDIKVQQDSLAASVREQNTLRAEFEEKQQQAAYLPAYRLQQKQVERMLTKVITILPKETEVPNLVEEISTKAQSIGLNFRSIRLRPEISENFYIELPMEINVIGTYHELAEFISLIAAMPRLVTLHDFSLGLLNAYEQQGFAQQNRGNLLRLILTAKTYRYDIEESIQ